jgi:succinate dehydrogenase/fumarate reductase cytochrome b subunit
MTHASGHDGTQQQRRPRGRHLGTWAFVANRLTRLGLVELFRRPVFLAFDLLLVAGLAFHGLNGLRVALVGSGLLVDRHRALLVAAAILVGLVVVVAAVRILA